MITINLNDEKVHLGQEASIEIYDHDGKLLTKIKATTSPQEGADGGYYPGVCLQSYSEDKTKVIIKK